MAEKILIKQTSITDGEKLVKSCKGEYEFKDGCHRISYTEKDEDGNTETIIEANENTMLLTRNGVFCGEMLFDRQSDRITAYKTFGLSTDFRIHTYLYEVVSNDKTVNIRLHYSLDDMKGGTIKCIQRIKAKITD